MRILIPLILFSITNCVLSKVNVKALTESLGQEVIEIGGPLKELPAGLEEEPSAENDDEDTTVTTIPAATKKETKKPSTTTLAAGTNRRYAGSDTEAIDDEEARIEKELSEIYKDNLDYKDSSEAFKPATKSKTPASSDSEENTVPALRARNEYKFSPDSTGKADIERFRTSVDEISCEKGQVLNYQPSYTCALYTCLQHTELPATTKKNDSTKFIPLDIVILMTIFFTIFCY